MNRVGKKSLVFKNTRSGRVVCGKNLNDALNVSSFFAVLDSDWALVKVLPADERVVISNGAVLPRNDITEAVARFATEVGPLEVTVHNRSHTYNVTYVDRVKVIIE